MNPRWPSRMAWLGALLGLAMAVLLFAPSRWLAQPIPGADPAVRAKRLAGRGRETEAEIAERLERLGQQGLGADGGAFRFQSPGQSFKGDAAAERALVKRPKPPLPDARLGTK